MQSLLMDQREIWKIWLPDGAFFKVGEDHVTKIEVYTDSGLKEPWVGVFQGTRLLARIPVRSVQAFIYASERDDG